MWQDEAREAARADWWQWLPGMLTEWPHCKARLIDHDRGVWLCYRDDERRLSNGGSHPGRWADLTDPATVGCIRSEVERLCAERGLWVVFQMHPNGTHMCFIFKNTPDAMAFEMTDKSAGLCALRALRWLHEQ